MFVLAEKVCVSVSTFSLFHNMIFEHTKGLPPGHVTSHWAEPEQDRYGDRGEAVD